MRKHDALNISNYMRSASLRDQLAFETDLPFDINLPAREPASLSENLLKNLPACLPENLPKTKPAYSRRRSVRYMLDARLVYAPPSSLRHYQVSCPSNIVYLLFGRLSTRGRKPIWH
jgi:hypothetical protein